MLIFTLKSSFVAALTISTIARLVTYAATCVALPLLRRRAGPATFTLPGGTVVALISLVLIAWLLLNSTTHEALTAIVVAAAGLLLFAGYRLYSRDS
jgi:amino acid transporter